MPTKGIITRKPRGIMYHGEPFGVPRVRAKTSAIRQNTAVRAIVGSGLCVCSKLAKNALRRIRPRNIARINTDRNGAGVVNSMPMTAYAR